MIRAALIAALLVAASCRTLPPAVPLPADDPRALAFLEAWIRDAKLRDGLRGHARLSVDSADEGVALRSKQILVVQRPARLRIEVLGFLNQALAVVVTDGTRYEVFRSGDRSYESGAVDAGLLWNEARIALRPEEAVRVLLGVPTPDPAWVRARAARLGDDGISIEWVDDVGTLRQRVDFGSSGHLRESRRFDRAGQPLWRVRYAGYRPVPDGSVTHSIAHSIELDVEAGRTHAEISLGDLELNPALNDSIFRLDEIAE